jgi:mannose-6-phosphate isomerase-like protein (cupin superfamily)
MEIKQTKEDREVLEKVLSKGVSPSKLSLFDFCDTAVKKPWGYEYLALESPSKEICAWVLHMSNNGTGTSMHCHKNKKTLIYVIEGVIWVKTLHSVFTLEVGEGMWIDKATFHAMGALEDGTILTEIESPSFKPDAIRYADTWGREGQEYESKCDLVSTGQLDCPYKTNEQNRRALKALMQKAMKRWGVNW